MYPAEIRQGILLHREIDSFTDRHLQVARCKKLLWPRHRHYSSVINDIFFDHFLAANWQRYSTDSLASFAEEIYAILEDSKHLMPQKAKEVLPRIIAYNWLVNYGEFEGVNRAMQGMARRASFPSRMDTAVEDLKNHYDDLEDAFHTFFPELIAHCAAYSKAQLSSSSQRSSS